MKRRTLIRGTAMLGATLLLRPASAQTAPTAERIWTGGPVVTMNDGAMRAEAVAESGGKVVAVGSREQVMKLKVRRHR